MTDSIDLDGMDAGEGDDEKEGNYGDWIWRGEGDPEDEPDIDWEESSADSISESTTDAESTTTDGSPDNRMTPGVPGDSGPVGVPESRGGAGAGTSAESEPETGGESQRTTDHGDDSDPDDMTMAMTYEAINRLEDPQLVITEAHEWADWVGIVGNVSTPVIRKFQRDERVELDFFGGSENGPASRLKDVTPDSMFYAERMVLVGVGDDEEIAEEAGWEFVPLTEAAEKAGWKIEHEV